MEEDLRAFHREHNAEHIEVLLDSSSVRPGYGSSLETLTAEVEGFDVTHVEAT